MSWIRNLLISTLLSSLAGFFLSSSTSACNIDVVNNSCVPIHLAVRYFDQDSDTWVTRARWTLPPGFDDYLHNDEGACLSAAGDTMYYWADSDYYGEIILSSGYYHRGPTDVFVEAYNKHLPMTQFNDDGLDFDLELNMRAYGQYDEGDCTHPHDYVVDHLSVAARMAEQEIIETFSCGGDGLLTLNKKYILEESESCARRKCMAQHDNPSDCRLLINEVGDHADTLVAVVARSIILKGQSLKTVGSFGETNTQTEKSGVDIKLQNKPSFNYDNTTTVVEQQKQDRKIEVGASYEQNIVAITDVARERIVVMGFNPGGSSQLRAGERDIIRSESGFEYADYRLQMNAIKECAIKGGKLCRVEQIFTSWNTDVHGLHVPTIEHLMVKAFDDGGLEDVRLLLNQGASVSAFPRGRPVFHESVDQEQENLPLVQLLLAHLKAGKHNINIVDRNGESALHLAAHNGHWAVAGMLLEAGMKADIPNKKGETPLSLAGQNFDTSMMRTLLEGGANPNVVPAAGNPLLHELIDRAQVSGNFKSLEFLLGWQDEDRSLDYRLVDAEGIAPHQVLVGNCPYSNEVWLRLREKAGNIDLPAPRTVEGFECSLQIRGDY